MTLTADLILAAVTVAMAIGLIWVARGQLSALNRTNQASMLQQINAQWTSDTVRSAREETWGLYSGVAGQLEGTPEKERELKFQAHCAEELRKIQEANKDRYLKLMDVCNFFETVGYMARPKVKYIRLTDILELYG